MFRVFVMVLSLLAISACQSMGGKSGSQSNSSELDAAQLLLSRADALYKSRQLDQSSQAYNEVLKLDPVNVTALYRLGNIAFRQQKVNAASAYYKKAVAADPRHSKAQYNLAMAYLSLAEIHLEYYTATAGGQADVKFASKIMSFLNQLSASGEQASESTSLELLTDQLLGE